MASHRHGLVNTGALRCASKYDSGNHFRTRLLAGSDIVHCCKAPVACLQRRGAALMLSKEQPLVHQRTVTLSDTGLTACGVNLNSGLRMKNLTHTAATMPKTPSTLPL